MERDHPVLVQHSKFHTQGWRANGDISLILSKSDPSNPSVDEILATEKYITGYACKGNQPTGALSDLFSDMVNNSDESSGETSKSLCTKLLMNTVKRDISSVEASFELSSIPLFRSSHLFQSVSLTGCRVLQQSDDLSQEHEVLNSDVPQPEWMEALRPNPNYDNSSLNFTFDDGGPDHDWSETSHIYPVDLGKDLWDNITSATTEGEK